MVCFFFNVRMQTKDFFGVVDNWMNWSVHRTLQTRPVATEDTRKLYNVLVHTVIAHHESYTQNALIHVDSQRALTVHPASFRWKLRAKKKNQRLHWAPNNTEAYSCFASRSLAYWDRFVTRVCWWLCSDVNIRCCPAFNVATVSANKSSIGLKVAISSSWAFV